MYYCTNNIKYIVEKNEKIVVNIYFQDSPK